MSVDTIVSHSLVSGPNLCGTDGLRQVLMDDRAVTGCVQDLHLVVDDPTYRFHGSC